MHEITRNTVEYHNQREGCTTCGATLGIMAVEMTTSTRMGVPLHPEVEKYLRSEKVQRYLQGVGDAAVRRFSQGHDVPSSVSEQVRDDAIALEEERIVGMYPIRKKYLEKAKLRQRRKLQR